MRTESRPQLSTRFTEGGGEEGYGYYPDYQGEFWDQRHSEDYEQFENGCAVDQRFEGVDE